MDRVVDTAHQEASSLAVSGGWGDTSPRLLSTILTESGLSHLLVLLGFPEDMEEKSVLQGPQADLVDDVNLGC